MGPVRERIAAVFSGRQGSGYLLSPRLVLTAAHVIHDIDDIRVATARAAGPTACTLLWSRNTDECDAALLLARCDLIPADTAGLSERMRWGVAAALTPVPGCQAIGFPYAQRDSAGRLESEQLVGTFKPGSALLGGRYVLDSAHNPPEPRHGSPSPWAGLSGAAVFAGELLIGVVASAPRGWHHSRIEATPARVLLEDSDFTAALYDQGVPDPLLTALPTPPVDPVAEFENRYTSYLAQKHAILTIFGLDLRNRSPASWPLDAAYLSLEAAESSASDQVDAYPPAPLPADQALAGHRRVLLRAVAGSGKTTLVQWLAVCAARQALGAHLDYLRDLIPFVLPLRTLIRRGPLPGPEHFLQAIGAPLTGSQPDGWAVGVLTAGRALVMVDGLDEISEREREQVRGWLRDLLIAYPDNLWLITSRPSAVDDSWLAPEGFTELTLSPMSRDDITSFIARWHNAARATCDDPEARERLDGCQNSLLTAIATQPDLARLATSPLMCGLICALHRDRHGYLPHGRKELYEAGLAMLLADRDQRRDIGAPDGIELTAEPQIQLLQRLAYWLIRNGRSELDRWHAERLIADALPAVPSAAAQGDARQILRHLLLRSGLLREPTTDTVEFIHRTFQDYLGARRAVEEWDIGLLIEKASDSQWEDVIRMAVAQARPRERAEILRALIARGDQDKDVRARVHVLAMACLEHATELDPAVRKAVEERAAALIPPRSLREARDLAEAGPSALGLLPGPAGLDDAEAEAVVVAASQMRSEAAIALLARFADHPALPVRSQLAWSWHRFDTRRYFDEVVSHLAADELYFVAHAHEHLRLLAELGGRPWMQIRGSFPAQELWDYLDPAQLTRLDLRDNHQLADLDLLTEFPHLSNLTLINCHAGDELCHPAIPPGGLPAVTNLDLGSARQIPDLISVVEGFPNLRRLRITTMQRTHPLDVAPLARLAHLAEITVAGFPQVIGAEYLSRTTSLARSSD